MVDIASQAHQTAATSEGPYSGRSHPHARSGARSSYSNPYALTASQAGSTNNLAFLSQSMQTMNFQDAHYPQASRNNSVSATSTQYPAYNMASSVPSPYWAANNQMMMTGHHAYNANGTPHSSAMYTPTAAQYITHGYGQGHEHSPMSQGWTPTHTGGEVPHLIGPRRESMSSAENDSPGTPSYPTYHAMTHGGVTILNRSPNGTYTSTPSPLGMINAYGFPMGKIPEIEAISPRLKMLVTKEPSIPPAIPAPSSPLKPLDRALENVRGETNVYIRGLMPDTTDEMLERWGKRFGDIKSSKSILDHISGRCKGFGFVRYHNYKDAEDCIRGFHHLGYEVSFARESFYSKLKAIADDGNTNLYVSNLPKSMNEHELGGIFAPHKVCSARILRNSNGTGRGVGFARFETRPDCDDVIRAFNNKTISINGEDYTVQIRFADTQEQKHLKQTTAAARQFRSAEYEYATQAHKDGWLVGHSPPGQMTSNGTGSHVGNEFETYLDNNTTSAVERPQNFSDPGWRTGSQRAPLATISSNTANIGRPAVSVNSTPLAKVVTYDSHDGGVDLGSENNGPVIVHSENSPTSTRPVLQ